MTTFPPAAAMYERTKQAVAHGPLKEDVEQYALDLLLAMQKEADAGALSYSTSVRPKDGVLTVVLELLEAAEYEVRTVQERHPGGKFQLTVYWGHKQLPKEQRR